MNRADEGEAGVDFFGGMLVIYRRVTLTIPGLLVDVLRELRRYLTPSPDSEAKSLAFPSRSPELA